MGKAKKTAGRAVLNSRPGRMNWSYPASFVVGMVLTLAVTTVRAHYRSAHSTPLPAATKTEVSKAWGVLQETALMLERPDEFLRQDEPVPEIRWVFGGA